MASRKYPIVTGQTYHVYNRSVARESIFYYKRDCKRFLDLCRFYQHFEPPSRFSYYRQLKSDEKKLYEAKLMLLPHAVTVFAFAIMPNHFHFILRQEVDNGINIFLSRCQNAYAKFLNAEHDRNGSVFSAQFKASRIENDDQLHHVIRYVHLNPVTAYMLSDHEHLKKYPWTSYAMYMGTIKDTLVQSEEILASFSSLESFSNYTFDQRDYQRILKESNHAWIDTEV